MKLYLKVPKALLDTTADSEKSDFAQKGGWREGQSGLCRYLATEIRRLRFASLHFLLHKARFLGPVKLTLERLQLQSRANFDFSESAVT